MGRQKAPSHLPTGRWDRLSLTGGMGISLSTLRAAARKGPKSEVRFRTRTQIPPTRGCSLEGGTALADSSSRWARQATGSVGQCQRHHQDSGSPTPGLPPPGRGFPAERTRKAGCLPQCPNGPASSEWQGPLSIGVRGGPGSGQGRTPANKKDPHDRSIRLAHYESPPFSPFFITRQQRRASALRARGPASRAQS